MLFPTVLKLTGRLNVNLRMLSLCSITTIRLIFTLTTKCNVGSATMSGESTPLLNCLQLSEYIQHYHPTLRYYFQYTSEMLYHTIKLNTDTKRLITFTRIEQFHSQQPRHHKCAYLCGLSPYKITALKIHLRHYLCAVFWYCWLIRTIFIVLLIMYIIIYTMQVACFLFNTRIAKQTITIRII